MMLVSREYFIFIATLILYLSAVSAFKQHDDGEPEGLDIIKGSDLEEECKKLDESSKALKQCPGEGKYPIKDQCKVFLFCSTKDAEPVPMCCPEGLHFDHIYRECLGKEEAYCSGTCPAQGIKYVDPQNPSGYLECTEHGVPLPSSCPVIPVLLSFDLTSKTCKPNEYSLEQEQVLVGPLAGNTPVQKRDRCRSAKKEEKAYMPKCEEIITFPTTKGECQMYKKCSEIGKPPTFACCAPSTHYDHITRKCVEENRAQCRGVCKTLGKKYANPGSSRTFMECTARGYPEIMKCPDDTRYNHREGSCVPPSPKKGKPETTLEVQMLADGYTYPEGEKKTEG